jgi:hypothetical protein
MHIIVHQDHELGSQLNAMSAAAMNRALNCSRTRRIPYLPATVLIAASSAESSPFDATGKAIRNCSASSDSGTSSMSRAPRGRQRTHCCLGSRHTTSSTSFRCPSSRVFDLLASLERRYRSVCVCRRARYGDSRHGKVDRPTALLSGPSVITMSSTASLTFDGGAVRGSG